MEILVKFFDRNEPYKYTVDILNLLRYDNNVEYVLNAETGEVIF